MEDFFNNFNWIMLIKAFVIGGLICIIGQILIDKTKLTPARILVTLLYAMQQNDAHRGLATLCIGGGMGCATIVERE